MNLHSMTALAVALTLATTSAYGQQHRGEERDQRPYSDPGRPSGPITPPGAITPMSGSGIAPMSGDGIAPMSGDGIAPIGGDYLGKPPDALGRGFQNPPGHSVAPRTKVQMNRDNRLPNSAVVVTLPPASTGRQGLPPQTWSLLSPRQQDLHRQAETSAMSSPLGEGFMWNDEGRYGEVRVMADRMFNNRPCRDFAHVVLIDGQRIDGSKTICR